MFWASAAGELVAKVGLALYEKWLTEQRIRNEEVYKMGMAALSLANRAMAYKVAHPVGAPTRDDPLGGLHSREGAPSVTLSPPDPGTTRPPE